MRFRCPGPVSPKSSTPSAAASRSRRARPADTRSDREPPSRKRRDSRDLRRCGNSGHSRRADCGQRPTRKPQPPPTPRFGYNVYEVPHPPHPSHRAPGATAHPRTSAPVAPEPHLLNTALLTTPVFNDPRVEFGTERCYVVRRVEMVGAVAIESAAVRTHVRHARRHVRAGGAEDRCSPWPAAPPSVSSGKPTRGRSCGLCGLARGGPW